MPLLFLKIMVLAFNRLIIGTEIAYMLTRIRIKNW